MLTTVAVELVTTTALVVDTHTCFNEDEPGSSGAAAELADVVILPGATSPARIREAMRRWPGCTVAAGTAEDGGFICGVRRGPRVEIHSAGGTGPVGCAVMASLVHALWVWTSGPAGLSPVIPGDDRTPPRDGLGPAPHQTR